MIKGDKTGYKNCTVNIFRCSLPKAMSISRSEILRKKRKRPENEKILEGHGSSIGAHRRLVGGHWRSLRGFGMKSDF